MSRTQTVKIDSNSSMKTMNKVEEEKMVAEEKEKKVDEGMMVAEEEVVERLMPPEMRDGME